MAGGSPQNCINNETKDEHFWFTAVGNSPQAYWQNHGVALSEPGNLYLIPDGDGQVQSVVSRSSTGIKATVVNTDNTDTGSSSAFKLETGGGSAGDAYITNAVTGVTDWAYGLDNSDSDSLVFSRDYTLGSNNSMEFQTNGNIVKPEQPAFLAYLGADDDNVTGDGTTATICCDSEAFDVGSDYDSSTGRFTAPCSGSYRIDVQVLLGDITNATKAYLEIDTSNRKYYSAMIGPSAAKTATNKVALRFSSLVDMDAADTIDFKIYSTGEGSLANDLLGHATTLYTFVSGCLIC